MSAGSDMAGRRTAIKPRTKRWLILLIGAAFLFGIAQPVLKLLADKSVFTTPQVVYNTLLLLLALSGPPSIAVIVWDYLEGQLTLRRTWEVWPLAVGAAITIPGFIVLAFMNLFLPAIFASPFVVVLLIATLVGCVLAMLGGMALWIHMEIGGE